MPIPKDCLIQNEDELQFVKEWMSRLNFRAYNEESVGNSEAATKLDAEYDSLWEQVQMYHHFSMTEKEFWGAA